MIENEDHKVVAGADVSLSGPGMRLREQRERRGLSTSDVAGSLRLTVATIEDLEQEHYQNLPPATFVRGYLKAYARLLEIDPEPLLQAFGGDSGATRATPLRVSGPVHTAPQMSRGMRRIMPLSLLVLIVAGVAYGAVEIYRGFGWDVSRNTSATPEQALEFASGPDREALSGPAEGPGLPIGDEALPEITEPDPETHFTNDLAGPARNAVEPETGVEEPEPLLQPETTDVPGDGVVELPAELADTEQPLPDRSSDPASADPGGSEAQGAADALVGNDAPADTADTARSETPSLRIRFSGSSWIEVYDAAGQRLLYGLFDEDVSEQVVTGQKPYSVVIGDTAHVSLEHDGESVDLGNQRPGRVARLQIPL